MSPVAKKTSIVAASAAAVAASGGLVWLLKKRAPQRHAYRQSIGWTGVAGIPQRELKQMRTNMSASVSRSPTTPTQTAGQEKPIETADPKPKPGFIGSVKETVYEFLNDDVMTQAAALAFYTGLAMAPLLTIVAWAAKVFLPDNDKYNVALAFSQVMGKQAYAPIEELLEPASKQASTDFTLAGIVSIVLVAISASGVFGQVQAALNNIWHLQARPTNGIIGYIKKRVLSLGMLASIMFLLLASLVVSATLQGRITTSGDSWQNIAMIVVNNVASLIVFTGVFAAMFKFVPDAKIDWKPVLVGGFIAAILFSLGKLGLSIYLGRGSYETSYGAAVGSFVALLVWVYYSAIILLIGAEATEVYARREGHALRPDEHAVRVITTTDPPK